MNMPHVRSGRRKRIALLPSAYAPSVGGVEVLTSRLAHHLVGRGNEVEVWTARSAGDGLPQSEVIDGVPIKRFVFHLPRLAVNALCAFPRHFTHTLRELDVAARSFQPDILHVQCFSANGVYATCLGQWRKIPLVVTLQGETVMDDHDIYDRSLTLRVGLRVGLSRASVVTGCSEFVIADAATRFALDRRKADVIYNAVDAAPASSSDALPLSHRRYVLGAGRLVWKKGFDLLIHAFHNVARDHPDVGLVIAGDGPQRAALEAIATNLGLRGRVQFVGRLDQAAIGAVMREADVFVMPSRVEPFGIVILEAWRAGVPVIATSLGGPPEFVRDGVNGVLLDPHDRTALSLALDRLLRSSQLRERLGEEGRSGLELFDWTVITGQYEACYASIFANEAPTAIASTHRSDAN